MRFRTLSALNRADQEPLDDDEDDKDCATFKDGVVGDTGDGVSCAK